jgi:hypothetical protein
LQDHIIYKANSELVAGAGEVNQSVLLQFGISSRILCCAKLGRCAEIDLQTNSLY